MFYPSMSIKPAPGALWKPIVKLQREYKYFIVSSWIILLDRFLLLAFSSKLHYVVKLSYSVTGPHPNFLTTQ